MPTEGPTGEPKKIFLSHKGVDKPRVRRFSYVLKSIGFDVWLDERSMPAGTPLERGIRQGFRESCAAVFFITPAFKDDNYLATEIEYAISEKRDKGDKFAIITIVFLGSRKGEPTVPQLLQSYVYKTVRNDMDGLQEILQALPLVHPPAVWRWDGSLAPQLPQSQPETIAKAVADRIIEEQNKQHVERTKEKVKVAVGISMPSDFYADLLNTGEVVAHIQDVAIGRDIAPGDDSLGIRVEQPLTQKVSLIVDPTLGDSATTNTVNRKGYDLPPRKQVRYILPEFPPQVLLGFAGTAPERLFLSVETFTGEIHRLAGIIIAGPLAKVIELMKRRAEGERPKIFIVGVISGTGPVRKELGQLRIEIQRKFGEGYRYGFQSLSPLPLDRNEVQQIAQDLVNGLAIGRIQEYEWRVESGPT